VPQDYGELTKHNVMVQEFVGENTYLCGYKPSDLAVLEALPFVSHAQVYPVGFVQHAMLGGSTNPKTDPEEPIFVNVHLHEGVAEGGKEIFEKIKKFSTAEIVDFNDSQVRINVRPKELDDIAAIDQVRTIEECPSITFHDTKAVDIIYGEQPTLFDSNHQGAGQIIAVADSGFDKGSTELKYVHPAFQNRLIDISDNRVLSATEKMEQAKLIIKWKLEQTLTPWPKGREPVVHPMADVMGHGTHVAGCAVGISSVEKAEKKNLNRTNIISSPAPKAKLYFQVVDPSGGRFPLLPDLFTAFPDAKIHNNSWGLSMTDFVQQPYNTVSTSIDRAMRQNPELLIVVAGGNQGDSWTTTNVAVNRNLYRQIGAEGAAKNSITVGATFNQRVMDKDSKVTNHAGVGQCFDDDETKRSSGALGIITEVATFSNKGPTVEGRLKPDVVAPGVGILSARSRAKRWFGKDDDGAGGIEGQVTDGEYLFKTGTSQAAPMVSGCAAVLREALIRNGTDAPSGALVKAMLVNGAVDLAGTQWVFKPNRDHGGDVRLMDMPPAPNAVQGFGLVNLTRSLHCLNPDSGRAMDLDMPPQGQKFSIAAPIPTGLRNLRVTLAWSDIAGTLLQDRLDLRVLGGNTTKEPDPVQLLDYQFRRGGNPTADGEQVPVNTEPNNVQKVTWKAIGDSIDVVRFEVTATRRMQPALVRAGQFALCWAFSNY
jgi:serine protease AprX